MKKIFLLVALFVAAFAQAQYPLTQNIGSSSTLVQVPYPGALKAAHINISFADTTAANLTYIKAYPGAQILTTGDSSLWFRNQSANMWIKYASAAGGSGGGYWSITGNYFSFLPAGFGIGTNSPDNLPLKTDGTTRVFLPSTGLGYKNDTTGNKVMTFDPTTKEWGYGSWFGSGGGGSVGTWQQTLTAGSRLTTANTINAAGNDFTWDSLGNFNAYTRGNNKLITLRTYNSSNQMTTDYEQGDGGYYMSSNDPISGNSLVFRMGINGSGGNFDATESGTYGNSYLANYGSAGAYETQHFIEDISSTNRKYAGIFQKIGVNNATTFYTNIENTIENKRYNQIYLDSTNGIRLMTKTALANTYKGLKLDHNHQVYVDSMATGGAAADSVVVITSGGQLKKRNISAIISGTGTVTSVATNTGSGITGGTITTSGTIAADTSSVLSTKANVLSQLTGYTPTSRTISVTAPVTGGGDLSTNRTIGLDTASGKWRSEGYNDTKYQALLVSGTNIKTVNSNSLLGSGNVSVGTVTSVATSAATGITGGTITGSGTIAADTVLLATRAWRQKGIDSVAALFTGYVPSSRTLTINGTALDLSANRSWSVGTVTSVGTGYGLSGGSITGSGTLLLDSATLFTTGLRRKDSATGTNVNGYLTRSSVNNYINQSRLGIEDNTIASTRTVTYDGGTLSWVGMANFTDTTNWKPMVVNTSTGEMRKATYWPGGGGTGSGETNTASNVGGGLGIFNSKVGVDLQFKSLTASDFDTASNLISIDYTNGQAASGSTKGFLTSTDWNTFNNKLSATAPGNYGNLIINRNAGYTTPATDSLIYTTAGGLVVKNTINSTTGGTFNTGNSSTGDVTIKGQTDNNLFWTDASADEVYIGTNTDNGAYKLQVNGNTYFNGTLNLPSTNSISFSGGTALMSYSTLFGSPAMITQVSAGQRWLIQDNGPSGAIIDLQLGTYPSYNNSTFKINGSFVVTEDGNAVNDPRFESDNNANMFFLDASANAIGINQGTPSAQMHFGAGTATAGTAPIKLTTGTALTTPEDGAIEYHGSHIYFTIGSTRYQLDQQTPPGSGQTFSQVMATTLMRIF